VRTNFDKKTPNDKLDSFHNLVNHTHHAQGYDVNKKKQLHQVEETHLMKAYSVSLRSAS